MPFKAGEFQRWALEDGRLDYSDLQKCERHDT